MRRASRPRPAVALELLEQVIHLDGLRHAFDRGQSGGALRGEVVGGDHDDGHLGESRVLQLLGAELPPVHDRHPEIEEDHAEPRRVCAEMLKRLLSVRGFHHGVALTFEDGREGAADVGVVFHDQDALRVLLHGHPVSRVGATIRTSGAASGSMTTNVAPWPSPPLLASTAPPCSSTRRRAMVSPSPRPACRFVAPAAGAWRKASKTWGRKSAPMPSPVSLTAMRASPSWRSSVTSTQPLRGVNLSALLKRVQTTCCSRSGSPTA